MTQKNMQVILSSKFSSREVDKKKGEEIERKKNNAGTLHNSVVWIVSPFVEIKGNNALLIIYPFFYGYSTNILHKKFNTKTYNN